MPSKPKKTINTTNIPPKPGIYWFKNKSGKIIYIGKALSLKHRVKSYFSTSVRDTKTKLLVTHIASVNYQVVPSEFEALLLEAKLVNEHKPKYNFQLKDDKSPLYIAITKKPYRIFPIRQTALNKSDLLSCYGPFTSGRDVRTVLRTLRRIFPYCSSPTIPKRQCLYYHLGLCPGHQNLSSPEYRKNIDQVRQILSGKTKELIKRIEKKMFEYARGQNFEQAENFKQQWQSLQHITTNWKNIPTEGFYQSKALLNLQKMLIKYQRIDPLTVVKIEGYDVSNLGNQIIVGSLVTFVNGEPDKSQYRRFNIKYYHNKGQDRQDDPQAIYQLVKRRLNHTEWLYPQVILVDGGKTQISAAFKALLEKALAQKISLLGLTKPPKEPSLPSANDIITIPLIKNNSIVSWKKLNYSPRSNVLRLLQAVRNESHRFAQKYYRQLHHHQSLH